MSGDIERETSDRGRGRSHDVQPAAGEIALGSDESRIRLRSPNLESRLDLEALMAMYAESYSFRYPFGWVHASGFWRAQSRPVRRRQILHFLAEVDGEPAGHMALRGDGRCFEFVSFAVLPRYRRFFLHLSRRACELIGRLAERQDWRTLTLFCPLDQKVQHFLAARCFDAKETALLPHYLPVGGTCMEGGERRASILIMSRAFAADGLRERVLYPAAHHRDYLAALCERRGLRYRFREWGLPPGYAAGIKFVHRSRFASWEGTVDPRDTREVRELRGHLARLRGVKHLYVKVMLDNSCCPAACEALEQDGCRPCGVAPGTRDSLIYARFDPGGIAVPRSCRPQVLPLIAPQTGGFA